MINQDFCEFVEYEIRKAIELSDNDQIKGFWCDGFLLNLPDNSHSQKLQAFGKKAGSVVNKTFYLASTFVVY